MLYRFKCSCLAYLVIFILEYFYAILNWSLKIFIINCFFFFANIEIPVFILTLYPAILLNLFIRFNSLFVDSLGFSTYLIMSFAKKDIFTSPFLICMPSISFACLIALAKISNTMFKRIWEKTILAFLLIFEYGISCRCFIGAPNQVGMFSFVPSLLRVFIMEWFCQIFFYIYCNDYIFFLLHSSDMVNWIDCLFSRNM